MPTAGATLLLDSLRAVTAAGATESLGKRVLDAKVHLGLGAEVDGDIGTTASPAVRRRCLTVLTLKLCRASVVRVRAVAIAVGLWTAFFLFRRPLLSIFDVVYSFIDRPMDATISLNGAARGELALAAVLGVVAVTDLRAPVAPSALGP